MIDWAFQCPICGEEIRLEGDLATCTAGHRFHHIDRIWRFLPPDQSPSLTQFIKKYEIIRRAEGRAADDAAFYQALPTTPADHPQAKDWTIRAQSYRILISLLETRAPRPSRILDIGAGNGWLSNRLAEKGHHVIAIDCVTNDWDGLGCHRYYETEFEAIEADFCRLPLAPDQADLVIFNASLHYTPSFSEAILESKRVLTPSGALIVVDTPVYKKAESGEQMVDQRNRYHEKTFGFQSDDRSSEWFLSSDKLTRLESQTGIRFDQIPTVPPFRQSIRDLKVAFRREREPAQFPILWGRFA